MLLFILNIVSVYNYTECLLYFMFVKWYSRVYFISHSNSFYDYRKLRHKYEEKQYWLNTNKQINKHFCVWPQWYNHYMRVNFYEKYILSYQQVTYQIYLVWLFEEDMQCNSNLVLIKQGMVIEPLAIFGFALVLVSLFPLEFFGSTEWFLFDC